MTKLCKFCKYAVFPSSEVDGSSNWKGRCYARMIESDSRIESYHTIYQHFKCSNGKFKAR